MKKVILGLMLCLGLQQVAFATDCVSGETCGNTCQCNGGSCTTGSCVYPS